MKSENGQSIVRLGDRTTHDGTIIEALPDLKHMGIPVALGGRRVEHPKCGDVFPVIVTGKRTHKGVIYAGGRTACRAILIRYL